MNPKTHQYRQGDVLITRVRRTRARMTPVARDAGRVVLAYGEVTGHAHAIAEPDVEILSDDDNRRFLRIVGSGGATLVHEEHATITLPKGTYEVTRQREYSPEAVRQVAD